MLGVVRWEGSVFLVKYLPYIYIYTVVVFLFYEGKTLSLLYYIVLYVVFLLGSKNILNHIKLQYNFFLN